MPHSHMTRNDWLRFGVVIAVAVAALVLLYPYWPLGDVLPLGLDLQGGIRIVLEPTEASIDALQEQEGLSDSNLASSVAEKVDEMADIIRARVDQYGLTNPDIRVRAGEPWSQIVINIPGIEEEDRDTVSRLITQAAFLEVRRVVEIGDSLLVDFPNADLAMEEPLEGTDGRSYLVERDQIITGASLSEATVEITGVASYAVGLEFTESGAQGMASYLASLPESRIPASTGITSGDELEYIAFVLDSQVISAPYVSRSVWENARDGWKNLMEGTEITGDFTFEEAKSLAISLRSGSFPLQVRTVEENNVGPTLGADSMRRGMMTIVIGFVLILIYMFVFYRVLGSVANIALILNMILVLGAMVAFNAVLTLPGIAGIILTIGMTVDANVIIFERVKEERRTGKSPLAAVRAGFEKSLSTLLDANITTLFMAAILFLLGTGPIRGFAVTLGIGVVGSLFCALVASRLLMEKTFFSRFIPAKVDSSG